MYDFIYLFIYIYFLYIYVKKKRKTKEGCVDGRGIIFHKTV